MRGFVVRVVFVLVRVYHTHIERHLPGIVGGYQHLRLLFGFRQFFPSQNRGIARLCKLHQLFDELRLLWRRRNIVQYLVHFRSVHPDILCCAVVGNLVVERRQLRHFDKVTEPLFQYDVVCHRELEVGCLLGENRRPRIETVDVLTFQFLRT